MPIITAPKTDKDTVKAAEPYIRGILAFILYTARPQSYSIDDAHNTADKFIQRLLKDL